MDFQLALFSYNKEEVLRFTREKLDGGYGVENFYKDYILTSLGSIGNTESDGHFDIAKEHVCTAIIRSVIEICYEYILKERVKVCGKKVVVSGLQHELHELAPRVTTDFFSLQGFDTYFLGTNIPDEDIVDTIKLLQAEYVALSITNFLHLTAVDELIKQIKKETSCKIVIGGLAVVNNKEYCETLGADYVLASLFEIGGIVNETCD